MALATSRRIGKIATLVTNHQSATAIALDHGLAYVGEYDGRRLTIVDVNDPTGPVLRSQLPLANQVIAVAASGSHVYLTGNGKQLQIVDATNPAAPVIRASLPGVGFSIAADATHVYLTTFGPGANKLRIFDVTLPGSPVLMSEIAIGSGFSDLVVIGTVAYLCTDNLLGGGNWLRMYNVANPASPVLGGSVPLGSATFRCLTTDGKHAYVGVGDSAGTSRLLVFDVSNPTAPPVAKGSLVINDIPIRGVLANNTLYLSFFLSGIAVILDTIDVSSVATPVLLDYTSLGSGDGAQMVSLGDYLLIPGVQFDIFAKPADQTAASLRVAAGVMVDSAGVSNGGLVNGITFGAVSGEGISSRRHLPGDNAFGIDFYTAFANRMAITNGGRVGIGRMAPEHTLDVNGSVAGVGPYLNLSDGRYKQRVMPILNAVERVERLQGVTFDWSPEARPDLAFPEGRQLGLLAQEVESVFPEAVTTAGDGTKSVAYSTLIPVLIQAIKEQQQQIDALKEALGTREG